LVESNLKGHLPCIGADKSDFKKIKKIEIFTLKTKIIFYDHAYNIASKLLLNTHQIVGEHPPFSSPCR